MADFLLFESPMGYSLFKNTMKGDIVGNSLKEVQSGVNDLAKFGKMVELASFLPFEYVLRARNHHDTNFPSDENRLTNPI